MHEAPTSVPRPSFLPSHVVLALLEHAPCGCFIKDSRRRWRFFNAASRAKLGEGLAAALLGTADHSFLPSTLAAMVQASDEHVLATQEPAGYNGPMMWGGVHYYVSSLKRCFVDPTDGERYILGFMEDLTEIHTAQQELAAAMDVVENGPATLVRWEHASQGATRLVYVSRNVTRLLGVSADVLRAAPQRFETHLHPEDAPTRRQRLEHALAQGVRRLRLEHRMRHAAGTERWIQEDFYIERDEQGRVLSQQSVLLDITPRRLALEALQESETRHRALARNFPDGAVLLFEHDLRCILAEGDALPDMALDKRRLEGAPLDEALPAELAMELAPLLRAALTGRKSVVETTMGGRVYETRVTPLSDTQGGVAGGMVVAQDITRLKEAEALQEALNAQLEEAVAQRTRALALQAYELEEANRKLTRLDALKSSFISTVSHELRTPLTSIFGFSRLIRRDLRAHLRPVLEETQAMGCARAATCLGKLARMEENLAIIEQEGQRLTRLVNDVLDLSRIEAGRLEWRDVDVSLTACIDEAVHIVSGQVCDNHALTLTAEVMTPAPEPEALMVRADPDRIVQVLVNLLGNAAKFTPEGEIRVQAAQRDGLAVVCVSDTGPGIPHEELVSIFDQFQQARQGDTMRRQQSGAGLGLAISRHIVEHYGGSIWAESRAGRGSTFSFTLPLLRCEHPPHAPDVDTDR